MELNESEKKAAETPPEKATNKDLQPKDAVAPTQKKRIFVILNPVSGTSDCDAVNDAIQKFAQEHNWECEVHETQKDEDLRQLLRQVVKKGMDLVIAAGGDGTVSAVVSGLVNTQVPLGILPAGTGNVLARDLNIPLDTDQALALLGGENSVRTMDAMQISNDYYVMNASVGVSADTMENTPRAEKRRFGMLAYLRHAFTTVMEARLHRFTAVGDGRKLVFMASEVMVANEKFLGLQPKMEGIEIDPNDGRLDVFLIRAQGFRDYINVAFRFLFRTNPEVDRTLRYLKIEDKITLDSRSPLSVQADGEVIGKTPVEIKLIRNALKVVVPQLKKE